MHMADALLSPAVGITMCAVSVGAMAVSAAKIKKDELCEKKIPIMAVAGAFVFAAQMINFTIPGTGSSGHIGGGMLLAGLLGGYPALLTLAAVLVVQCLFFADGGLLALGCNIFNMGVIPCLLIYPLIFKPILKKGFSKTRIAVASVISVVVGLQLGAFGVVVETAASGVTELPFKTFLLMMQPIHLAIGLVEGFVTAGVLCFVHSMRPEIMESTENGTAMSSAISVKKVVIVLAAVTVLVGGVISIYASSNPDGLEWSIENITGSTEVDGNGGSLHSAAESVQGSTSILADYDYASAGEDGSSTGTSVSGLVGGVATFAIAGIVGLGVSIAKKKKNKSAAVV